VRRANASDDLPFFDQNGKPFACFEERGFRLLRPASRVGAFDRRNQEAGKVFPASTRSMGHVIGEDHLPGFHDTRYHGLQVHVVAWILKNAKDVKCLLHRIPITKRK
jgi:hypothetical protein